jgi:hypothetical protein
MKTTGDKLNPQRFFISKQKVKEALPLTTFNLLQVFTFILFVLLCSSNIAYSQHAIPPEVWIEMRKMYRDKIPQTTINEEIAALAGPQARRAGPKLIDRGPEALPAVHKALLNPKIEPRQAISLFQVIRAISDTSSVDIILELLQRDSANPLSRDALLALALLPATEMTKNPGTPGAWPSPGSACTMIRAADLLPKHSSQTQTRKKDQQACMSWHALATKLHWNPSP